jgi:hypothetical protein
MGKEFLSGQTSGGTKESIPTIKRMAMVSSNGQTAKNTRVFGAMVSSMEGEFTSAKAASKER